MTDTAPDLGDEAPLELRYVPLDTLLAAPRNPKGHAEEVIGQSIQQHGFVEPPLIDERTGFLIGGHGRRNDLRQRRDAGLAPPRKIRVDPETGEWLVPTLFGYSSEDDEDAERLLVGLNRTVELGGWVIPELAPMLADLQATPIGLHGTGYTSDDLQDMLDSMIDFPLPDPGGFGGGAGAGGGGIGSDEPSLSLADRFVIPPFSVFDARQGYWRERKRQWLSLGIASEVGRARNLLGMSEAVLTGYGDKGQPNRSTPGSDSGNDPQFFYKKRAVEARLGRELSSAEFIADHYEGPDTYDGGTSIFDPVLCEVAYRWFCPPEGTVLDPFAGGSVRGIVAGKLGLSYTGVELRAEQVAANEEQRALIAPEAPIGWLQGDSRQVLPTLEPGYDFLFSCPPYFDLEKYSDDPEDLSAMTWEEFSGAYRTIIADAVSRLADDRFACFVVGEIRDKKGMYRGFLPLTVQAFEAAGAALYNEAILLTSVGSLALRAARIFGGGRKLAKSHQQVLVFVKGDPAAAAANCGELVLPDPAELFGLTIDPAALGDDEALDAPEEAAG